jgi:5,10-methylene-tetrahydrofolate dehydrogenase/methenyl tetrahydrofolate cyclohydrolase
VQGENGINCDSSINISEVNLNVAGGVGAVTTSVLMKHVVEAAEKA